MGRTARILITVVTSIVAFVTVLLFVVPSGCSDIGRVPSWERCTTLMETPAFSVEDWGWNASLNVLPPITAAVLVGFASWLLLRRSRNC